MCVCVCGWTVVSSLSLGVECVLINEFDITELVCIFLCV